MDSQTCESGLQHRLEMISMASPAMHAGSLSTEQTQVSAMTSDAVSAMLTAEIQFKILSRVMDFLAANSSLLPSKEVLLASLSKAIDAAFTAANKPLISAILKPIIKAQILTIVGNLYDKIVNTGIEV